MYRIQLDPGPWAQYVKRADNIGLPLHEVTKKYMMESNLYATQLFEALQSQQQSLQSTAVAAVGSGGASAPPASSIPSNCIEFINNTSDGTECQFWIETSAPTNYTITWGDGETTTGQTTTDGDGGVGDGSGENRLEIVHDYADSDTEYTTRICFDDISLVTYLNFNGTD
jgi:hypothetical protein